MNAMTRQLYSELLVLIDRVENPSPILLLVRGMLCRKLRNLGGPCVVQVDVPASRVAILRAINVRLARINQLPGGESNSQPLLGSQSEVSDSEYEPDWARAEQLLQRARWGVANVLPKGPIRVHLDAVLCALGKTLEIEILPMHHMRRSDPDEYAGSIRTWLYCLERKVRRSPDQALQVHAVRAIVETWMVPFESEFVPEGVHVIPLPANDNAQHEASRPPLLAQEMERQ